MSEEIIVVEEHIAYRQGSIMMTLLSFLSAVMLSITQKNHLQILHFNGGVMWSRPTLLFLAVEKSDFFSGCVQKDFDD